VKAHLLILAALVGLAAPAGAGCLDCHTQAKGFAPFAHRATKGEAGCVSCHGDGKAHEEAGGDKTLIKRPQGRLGAETCLTCHEKGATSHRTGAHAPSDTVSCTTCHSIHGADLKSAHLLAKPQLTLCGSCHAGPVASHLSKPFSHRLGRGGMECASCHDPHGAPGRRMLKETRAAELPCLSCHTDKRGPFVFEHVQGVTGDCLTCHENHGSSNPKHLIRAKVSQLCLECHSTLSPGALGSQPPSFHDMYSPRYQNCVNCHTAIHGSNRSPRLLK
jgi:DmsE family decaheme c-type cytochrome